MGRCLSTRCRSRSASSTWPTCTCGGTNSPSPGAPTAVSRYWLTAVRRTARPPESASSYGFEAALELAGGGLVQEPGDGPLGLPDYLRRVGLDVQRAADNGLHGLCLVFAGDKEQDVAAALQLRDSDRDAPHVHFLHPD